MSAGYQHILDLLPYEKPFLFVDELVLVTDEGVEGIYTFKTDEYFYKGHFKDHPITPGVILTECMAQIGMVCLGIHLQSISDKSFPEKQFVLTSNSIDFYKVVLPGETVRVISEKEYFRFNKLKCKIRMLNKNDELVCKGTMSGMLISE